MPAYVRPDRCDGCKGRASGPACMKTCPHDLMKLDQAQVLPARCLLAAGGAVNIFRPPLGTGRARYPVWNAGSTFDPAQRKHTETATR